MTPEGKIQRCFNGPIQPQAIGTWVMFGGIDRMVEKDTNVGTTMINHPPNHHRWYKPFPHAWFIIVIPTLSS